MCQQLSQLGIGVNIVQSNIKAIVLNLHFLKKQYSEKILGLFVCFLGNFIKKKKKARAYICAYALYIRKKKNRGFLENDERSEIKFKI